MSIAIVSLFSSCEKKEDEKMGVATSGPVLVVSNEGPFLSGSGSISVIELSSGTVNNDVYAANNGGATVGSILQDLYFANSNGFAVVNNADEVIVFDAENYNYENVVTVDYPRFMTSNGEYGYISGGNASGKVTKINLSSGAFVDDVSVGENPQGIVAGGNWVATTNFGAYPNNDSTISVVNSTSMELDTNIHVGLKPNDLVLDANGDLWVLVTASYIATAKPELVRLDTASWEIKERLVLGSESDNISKLAINESKSKIYYSKSDGVYVYELGQPISSTPFVPKGSHSNFYGLEINPNNGHVFTFDAGDYSSKGVVREFNSVGDSITQYKVGVIPNGGVFR